MEECPGVVDRGCDRATQASMNGIYVKAREFDRGNGERPDPIVVPPGAAASSAETAAWDAVTHASKVADAVAHTSGGSAKESDEQVRALDCSITKSDCSTHAADGLRKGSGVQTHASGGTIRAPGGSACVLDDSASASDAQTRAPGGTTHASGR